MNQVTRRPSAIRDLVEQALYLEEQAGLEVAERFLEAAEDAFTDLAHMPGMGRRRELPSPQFADVRQWAIRGFENYLVFYRPITGSAGGVEVLRVLHGARDIERVFDEEESES